MRPSRPGISPNSPTAPLGRRSPAAGETAPVRSAAACAGIREDAEEDQFAKPVAAFFDRCVVLLMPGGRARSDARNARPRDRPFRMRGNRDTVADGFAPVVASNGRRRPAASGRCGRGARRSRRPIRCTWDMRRAQPAMDAVEKQLVGWRSRGPAVRPDWRPADLLEFVLLMSPRK